MKKNIVRVLSLLLVAAMLFGCAACTQTINVRFVNKDGDDLDLSGIINANATPASNTPASDTPASQAPASETPASQAPASETPASQAPASETPASQAPASEAPASTGMPTGTQAIADFYKAAVNKVKNDGAAGYIKKEWQALPEIHLMSGPVDKLVMNIVDSLMTPEDKAENQDCPKGSDEAKNRFIHFTLSDYSKIASATCTANGSNYDIKIVMQDEDTPKNKESSFLSQVSNSLLYWDTDITPKFSEYKISDVQDAHVVYKASTIEATITPDGNFVSLKQNLSANITVGSAKLTILPLKNISAVLNNYATYTNFQY